MSQIQKKILLVGASGRMGSEIISAVKRQSAHVEQGDGFKIVGGIVHESDDACGSTVDGIEHRLSSDWQPEYDEADVIIDFSSSAGAAKASSWAKSKGIALLECSTGLSDEQERLIAETAEIVPVVRARNTCVGVNVLAKLVYEAVKMLGDGVDIELVELHHKHKTDSPSGTAYLLLEEAARARGVPLSEVISCGRSGTKLSRSEDEIGAQAVRGGDVAGEHTVYLMSEGERIELTHRASKRSIWADGALRAAAWLIHHSSSGGGPGLFTMADVLRGE